MIRKLEKKIKKIGLNYTMVMPDFYKVPMNTRILDTIWGWIHDETHDVNAICFELEGKIQLELLIIEQCQDQLRANILVF